MSKLSQPHVHVLYETQDSRKVKHYEDLSHLHSTTASCKRKTGQDAGANLGFFLMQRRLGNVGLDTSNYQLTKADVNLCSHDKLKIDFFLLIQMKVALIFFNHLSVSNIF